MSRKSFNPCFLLDCWMPFGNKRRTGASGMCKGLAYSLHVDCLLCLSMGDLHVEKVET